MEKLILSPEETLNQLSTKEEFEQSKRLDEDGDDLLEDKLMAEYMENMEADFDNNIED
jgi:hypothetical protein